MTNILKERLDDCISTILKYPNLFGAEIDSLKLISQYGKKPAWSRKFTDLPVLMICLKCARSAWKHNQTPAVTLMDFYEFPEEVKAIHKTTILCHDWIMEREYLDEAISELLEKRPDLTN